MNSSSLLLPKTTPVTEAVFTSSEIVFHILSYSSVTDLLNKYQMLNSTAHQLVSTNGYLLAACLRNALGMSQNSELWAEEIKQREKDEKQENKANLLYHHEIVSLLHLAKFCIKHAKKPPPMQMFAFRSSIGADEFWGDRLQIFNLATGYKERGFCSREGVPGCFTMLPFPYDNVLFQSTIEDFQIIEDFTYSWKDSMGVLNDLQSFVERDLRFKNKGAFKERILSRFQDSQNIGKVKKKQYSWQQFEQWIHQTWNYANEVRKLVNRTKRKVMMKSEEGIPLDLSVTEFDASEELKVMKNYLFTMFSFCITTTPRYTCNIKCFAILLHNEPIVVEKSQIYEIVKAWNCRARVRETLAILKEELPETYQEEVNPMTIAIYFRQIFYQTHKKEKVRLLCWGECRNIKGDFYFNLPSSVSTRFITLVGISNYYEERAHMDRNYQNLDIHKFMPFGFIVPCF